MQTFSLSFTLQNKAIKIITSNAASLEEPFQNLNILCLPKLYALSVGKYMQSYYNKPLPNNFVDYFIRISPVHPHSRGQLTSNNVCLRRVNSSSGKCFLIFLGPKVWSSISDDTTFSIPSDDTSLQPVLPSNGNWKNISYMKKMHNYER